MVNNSFKECRRQFILDPKNTIAQERINRQYWKKYHQQEQQELLMLVNVACKITLIYNSVPKVIDVTSKGKYPM